MKQVRQWGLGTTDLYPHMPIGRVARALDESASARTWRGPAAGHRRPRPLGNHTFSGILLPQKPKIGRIDQRAMNRLAKFDAVTVQKNKETVNDISTPCLSAYVDNKNEERRGFVVYRLKEVICFGEGAGANILARFAVCILIIFASLVLRYVVYTYLQYSSCSCLMMPN